MQDPLEWLPDFISTHWDVAVESLRSSGVNVSATRPSVRGAQDPRSGGDASANVGLKVYEAGDLVVARRTHGDADRDSSQTYHVKLERKGNTPGLARKAIHEAVLVLVRLLELYRSNPHEDWNRIEALQVRTVENYSDYQHRVLSLTLHRYGEPMVAKVLQDQD